MYLPYSGVGSRKTPLDICAIMTKLAARLEQQGYTLRSGAADRADSAFEEGVVDNSRKEIYIAWNGFEDRTDKEDGVYCLKGEVIQQAEKIASTLHPAWDTLKKDGTPVVSRGAKGLHTRNVFQVLGHNLKSPSRFLVCWAEVDKQGIPKGGTRTAWQLAVQYNIPCFNLLFEEDRARIEKFIN